MSFKRFKKYNRLAVALGVISFFLLKNASAQITLPSPGESVLVIYYADTSQTCGSGGGGGTEASPTYPMGIMMGVTTALGAIPAPYTPTVTLLPIYSGDFGIYGQLNSVLHLTSLSSFCQVWDLRFLDQCDNQPWAPGDNQPDVITNTGANNDAQLYESFLAAGGSLFFQGEHHDFYARNNNLIALINSVATSPIISTICATNLCPDVNTGNPYTDNNPFTANYNFNTIYNNLTGSNAITTVFGGGIPPADYGSGLPLIMIPSLEYSGTTGGLMMMWEGADLSAAYGGGKLIASFETNAFVPVAETGAGGVYSEEALQNVYAELSGCQRYTVTKTFASNTVCVGSSSSFSICVDNNGTVPLTNYSISDTIPTCLQYNSDSTGGVAPSATGNASNLYWWTYSSIGVGQSACVTVNYTATTFPPCP